MEKVVDEYEINRLRQTIHDLKSRPTTVISRPSVITRPSKIVKVVGGHSPSKYVEEDYSPSKYVVNQY